MAAATDSTPVPSRRAFLAHAALSGVAATRPPIFTVPELASGLATACAWASGRQEWLRVNSDAFDDKALHAENEQIQGVFHRAVTEPSAGLADLAAKARMLLDDLAESEILNEEFVNERLILVVLREVAALA